MSLHLLAKNSLVAKTRLCDRCKMIELGEHSQGLVLPVRAQPGASKAGLRGEHRGALKVSVTQIAEKGKANEAVIETLADGLRLKRSQIELIAGQSQRDKRFLIRGIARDELARRIAAVIDA
jgi:uncharacterized protein (TIGR00251 family)